MPHPDVVGASGVNLAHVNAGAIHISGVTVTNVTQLPEPPPLWAGVPRLPARMVGRDTLIDTLVARLARGDAALHGLPGVGKSALAVVLAHHPTLLGHFSDGVLWAGLGPTPDVMSVLVAWGDALGVDVSDQVSAGARSRAVADAIGTKRLLLVIDDAWQGEPARLLRCGGPYSAHLLTTRELALARGFVAQDAVFPVPELEEDPAVLLLRDLAPEACAADPAAARALALAVGGLPLALELIGGFLAAPERGLFAKLAAESMAALADPAHRLALAGERLGSRDGRAVTLQETVALSLDTLPAPVQTAFHALGAFAPKPAEFDLPAAEAVTEADAAALATLVGRGLVEQTGAERLALHQIVADVACTALEPAAVERHRAHYLAIVNADREDWRRIEGVYPQIQRAWRQLPAAAALADVLAAVWALRVYQKRRGLSEDALAWAARGLALARAEGALGDVATLLNNLGRVYSALGDKPRALEYYEQALPLIRQVGDKGGESITRFNIAMVHEALGDLTAAEAQLRDVVSLDEAIGHPDLASDRAVLAQIRQRMDELAARSTPRPFWRRLLTVFRSGS